MSSKKKWPKSIKIGPYNYKLSFNKDYIVSDETDEDGRVLVGQTHHELGTIIISEKQSETSVYVTLLHELIHAMRRAFVLDRFCDSPKKEEDFCDAMGVALYQVIIDNPELFKQITK